MTLYKYEVLYVLFAKYLYVPCFFIVTMWFDSFLNKIWLILSFWLYRLIFCWVFGVFSITKLYIL